MTTRTIAPTVKRNTNGRPRVRTVDPELLWQEIASGRDITVFDVRATSEFRGPRGRIPGARSLPLATIAPGCQDSVGRDRAHRIVVVSEHGESSRLAAIELELAGFTEVQSLTGGMARWWSLDLPLERRRRQRSASPRHRH